MINLKLNLNTFSTLIAGLYCTYTSIDPRAVPTSLYIELAEKLEPYMENWDYEKQSFEDWITHNLLIAPMELFSESELNECKNNAIYIERQLGNVVLIATGDI